MSNFLDIGSVIIKKTEEGIKNGICCSHKK